MPVWFRQIKTALFFMNKYNHKIPDSELKWILCDLDCVLAKGIWPEEGIGEPIEGAVLAVNLLTSKGYKIIIHTARHWSDYENIENWLNDNGVIFSRIVCGKILAKFSIDDRAISFDGNWNDVLKKIK